LTKSHLSRSFVALWVLPALRLSVAVLGNCHAIMNAQIARRTPRARRSGRLINRALPFVLCICAQAATTINSISATATQALVAVTRPTANPLTAIKVSEDPTFATVLDDVNATLFPGSDLEAAHLAVPAVVSGSTTFVILRIGLRTAQQASDGKWHSRAAATATHYYITVTGDAPATGDFVTSRTAGIYPEGPPTDPNGFGQLGFPEFTDWSKPVIEPHSGLKTFSVDPNAGWSWSVTLPLLPLWYSGGTGYSNISNITTYGGTGTTTTNTNPVFIALNIGSAIYSPGPPNQAGYYPYTSLSDLAVDLYGAGSDASGTHRTQQGCISIDSGQSCFTPPQTVAYPRTTQAAIGTLPGTGTPGCTPAVGCYPLAYFASWGGKALQRKALPKQGYVSVSGNVLTLTKAVLAFGGSEPIGQTALSVGAYFDTEWAAGVKLYIPASNCTNGFCTVASVQSATQLTLIETPTMPADSIYHAAALGIILNKTTATGSLTFSARFKLAQASPQMLGFRGGCANTTVTASDGLIGYPCIFGTVREAPGGLYLIGTSGVGAPAIRFISPFPNIGCTNVNPSDCPNGANPQLGPTAPQFDPTDLTKVYITTGTNSGNMGIFRGVYGGRDGNPAQMWLPYNKAFTSSTSAPPATAEFTWTNLTPATTCPGSMDIRCQILTNTNFNESLWGSAGNVQADGQAGPYLIMHTLAGGQGSACWVHAFTASTGAWFRSWNTADATTGGSNPSNGILRYTGCHSTPPVAGSDVGNAAVEIDTAALKYGSTGLYYGPFVGAITAIKKSGVYSANTTLPWPPDATYDSACPDPNTLPAWVVTHGAINDQCAQLQLSLPCSQNAGAAEAAAGPCPYNSSWSAFASPLIIGDQFKDATKFDDDSEGFMVVTTPVLAFGNTWNVTVQRNAPFSYCARTPGSSIPKDGNSSAAQVTHSSASGWGYYMFPRDLCSFQNAMFVDILNNVAYDYNTNIVTGHGETTLPVTPSGVVSRVSSGSLLPDSTSIYTTQFLRPFAQIGGFNDTVTGAHGGAPNYQVQSPKFALVNSITGVGQSYVNSRQSSAAANVAPFAYDFSILNGSLGADLESPRQFIGGSQNLALQGGTASVYKMTLNGVADIKHQALNVWAGRRYLTDISGPVSLITDANPWTYCYAYAFAECRPAAAIGSLFVVLPVVDALSGSTTACWASQINLSIPCAFSGPTQSGQARQIYIGASDGGSQNQTYYGWLGMGPGQQEVYSNFVPTPDGRFGMFSGLMLNGYDTGIKMVQLPPPPNDSISRSTFVPVQVGCPVGSTCLVEFGYDEYGSDHVNKFYCTTRQENCRVAGAAINEPVPFSFASTDSPVSPVSGVTLVPALPNHMLYYRKVINGVNGILDVVVVP